jgi:hypothetical protein
VGFKREDACERRAPRVDDALRVFEHFILEKTNRMAERTKRGWYDQNHNHALILRRPWTRSGRTRLRVEHTRMDVHPNGFTARAVLRCLDQYLSVYYLLCYLPELWVWNSYLLIEGETVHILSFSLSQ